MRLAVAAALAALGLIAPGDRATATFGAGRLVLTLHYPMTCGQPGRGPLVLTLPSSFRTGLLKAALNERQAPVSHHGGTVQVRLPKPPPLTCMSITEGTLRVSLAGLHASSGIYSLTAQVNRHFFRTAVRVG